MADDGEEGDLEAETGPGEEEIGDPEDEDEGTETFSFVPDVEEHTCDPWMQDCPPGEKCVPYSIGGGPWDSNKCVEVSGDGQPGDTCSYDGITIATDSCGADSHCWDVMDIDGQLQGVCTSFCEGNANEPICGPETACLIANDGAINLCVTTCDPLSQDCGSGLGCFWANDNFQCIFTAGEILSGEPCGFINDCAPGNLCATAEVLPVCNGSACCTPYCDLTAPQCADPATECSAFFEEGTAPPNYESVGVCILPGT
ncbi:MAG TPA: hypothetical protein VM869_20265 [Enhygromyxa sp.]|nr:hypothetical protein [Enhygromyxa sp.]